MTWRVPLYQETPIWFNHTKMQEGFRIVAQASVINEYESGKALISLGVHAWHDFYMLSMLFDKERRRNYSGVTGRFVKSNIILF